MEFKVCGLTNFEDATFAASRGAHALGFVFYEPSPRCADINEIADFVIDLPRHIAKVGVFVDEDPARIHQIYKSCRLDFVQLHGKESPQYCQELDLPYIKAFRVHEDFDFNLLGEYGSARGLLLDTYKKGLPGGTGESFNWSLLNKLDSKQSVILSGGLGVHNVLEACKTGVAALDLSSSLENEPGKKSHEKISALFAALGQTGRLDAACEYQSSIFNSNRALRK